MLIIKVFFDKILYVFQFFKLYFWVYMLFYVFLGFLYAFFDKMMYHFKRLFLKFLCRSLIIIIKSSGLSTPPCLSFDVLFLLLT
jgi:hypothetical protein